MSYVKSFLRLTANGYFMHCHGPEWYKGNPGCQKKLCFVATDQALLAEVLL